MDKHVIAGLVCAAACIGMAILLIANVAGLLIWLGICSAFYALANLDADAVAERIDGYRARVGDNE